MKKFLAMIMLTTMLISSTANAGILILTGDIGNKFDGYKVVGWLTIAITGVSLIGLVVDGDSEVDSSVQLPELSEASLDLIKHSTRNDVESGKNVITTVKADVADQILALEGLSGTLEGHQLFQILTTK